MSTALLTPAMREFAAAVISRTATRVPYRPTAPMQSWTCDDTLRELQGALPRPIPVRQHTPRPDGVGITWSDYFAGSGGSTQGIFAAGGTVVLAVNHWPLALETHNFNHQDTDHDVVNVARADPSRYPGTDCAWFSPECTYWSIARGDKCDYDLDNEDTVNDVMDDEGPAAREARWRSRMLMTDVVRFSEYHQYKAVIVENVPDILKWAGLDRMIGEMHAKGYAHKIIVLNSAFAGGLGMPAPQLRDRVYIVFWKTRYRTPDWNKWLRPKAVCSSCGDTVRAIYTPKPGKRRPMRYGPRNQYTYRCPHKLCAGAMANPFVLPAAAAIDWSLPSERIGDRKRPLVPNTRMKIAEGLRRFPGQPNLTPTGGNWNDTSASVFEPLRTRTTRESEALIVPLRNNVVAAPTSHPLVTLAASGTHHPLVRWDHLLYAYDTGLTRSIAEPMPSQTTIEGDALIGPAVEVDDCTLRMLTVDEIMEGMGFRSGYVLLGTRKKDKIRMLGNAVTPCSSRDLAACVMEAITGDEYELFDLAA